jgi:uncharacterized protein (TIGR02646 family)
MRQIRKQAQPPTLTEWIAANQSGENCSYHSVSGELRKAIREALVAEQRGLCAYTGRKIDAESCHIEHLKPQVHCQHLEDVTYRNLVAAVPQPNTPRLPYGAHLKDNWPSNDEAALFVSPLQDGCSARFSFSFKGEIHPSNPADAAAVETIKRLGLDHGILVGLRREAIRRTIQLPGKHAGMLDTKSARRRLHSLQQQELNAPVLEQFSFALMKALEKHIERIQKVSAKKKKV